MVARVYPVTLTSLVQILVPQVFLSLYPLRLMEIDLSGKLNENRIIEFVSREYNLAINLSFLFCFFPLVSLFLQFSLLLSLLTLIYIILIFIAYIILFTSIFNAYIISCISIFISYIISFTSIYIAYIILYALLSFFPQYLSTHVLPRCAIFLSFLFGPFSRFKIFF